MVKLLIDGNEVEVSKGTTILKAAEMAGVGPMAGVAGAIAEYVGKGLKTLGAREVIVENGGDIYIAIEWASTITCSHINLQTFLCCSNVISHLIFLLL